MLVDSSSCYSNIHSLSHPHGIVQHSTDQGQTSQSFIFYNYKLVKITDRDGKAGFGTSWIYVDGNGAGIQRDIDHFKSPEDAKNEFDKEVRGAGKVLERGNELDKESKAIETRVLLQEKGRGGKGLVTGILVCQGNQIRRIAAYSREDALAFEEWLKH